MNILFLTIDRSTRVDGTLFTGLHNELKKITNVKTVTRKLTKHPYTQCVEWVLNGVKPEPVITKYLLNDIDIIFTDSIFAFMSEKWNDINIPKVCLIEDEHGEMPKVYIKYAIDNDFKIAYRYKTPMIKNHSYALKDSFWLPHSIPLEIFHDYNLSKSINISLFGTVNEKMYPERFHFLEKYRSNIFHPERPKETDKKKYPIGIDYAKLINSSKISMTCFAKVEYAVSKYFEIPACNTVLLAPLNPELRELGFIHNETCFELKYTDPLAMIKDEWSFVLNRIQKQGMEMVQEKHSCKIRAKQLLEKLQSYL